MTVPIVTVQLVPQERILGVRRLWEVPTDPQILTKAYEEHSLSPLWHPEIGRVHDLGNNPIIEACAAPTGVVILQPSEMNFPILIAS